jgi:hypothetical protein
MTYVASYSQRTPLIQSLAEQKSCFDTSLAKSLPFLTNTLATPYKSKHLIQPTTKPSPHRAP